MSGSGSPFSGKEGERGNSVKAIRPNPGLAGPQDSYLGEPLPSTCPSSHYWAAARDTFNSHFRVLKKAPSASKVQGGGTHSLVRSALKHGASPVPQTPGRRRVHSAAAPAGGHAGPYGLSPHAGSSRKEGRGGAASQGTAVVPMITHTPQAGGLYEGFGNYYNHLLCWVETDPVSLCFRALKAGEARRSRFQHKRLHNS